MFKLRDKNSSWLCYYWFLRQATINYKKIKPNCFSSYIHNSNQRKMYSLFLIVTSIDKTTLVLYIVKKIIATNRQLCKSSLNVVCNRIIIKPKLFAFGLPNSKSWKPFSKMLVTIWKGTTSKTKVLWRLLLLGVRLCREAGCYFCQLLLRTLYWPLGCNTYDTVVRRMFLDISCVIFVTSY